MDGNRENAIDITVADTLPEEESVEPINVSTASPSVESGLEPDIDSSIDTSSTASDTLQQEQPVIVHQTVIPQEPIHLQEERIAQEVARVAQEPSEVQKRAQQLPSQSQKHRAKLARQKRAWEKDMKNVKHYNIGKPLGIPIYDDAFIFNHMADYMVHDLKGMGIGFESIRNPYYNPMYRAGLFGLDDFLYGG